MTIQMQIMVYDEARAAVERAHKIDDAKKIRDAAEALAVYARQRNDPEMEAWIAEIRVRAARRIGEISAKLPDRRGSGGPGRIGNVADSKEQALRAAKIDPREARRCEKLAEIPDGAFESRIAKAKSEGRAVTGSEIISGVVKERRKAKAKEPKRTSFSKTSNRKIYSPTEWLRLSQENRDTEFLHAGSEGWNDQTNEDIGWARHSWNPVTGCLHSCSYCYARDIAESNRGGRAFPRGFAPLLHVARLRAPLTMQPPDIAKTDARYRNVFVCSMADLFGRWVPGEWIKIVLDVCAEAKAWNFLFLTKFPKRYAGIEFPPNAWVGTTIDYQVRVPAAVEAMASCTARVKWLSLEPLLEPLEIDLSPFQWIVIGGASKSKKTPEYRVPFEWWAPIYRQAREKKIPCYLKNNLWEPERALPGEFIADPPLPHDFSYLKGKSRGDIERGEQ